jgi:hypothetical protein
MRAVHFRYSVLAAGIALGLASPLPARDSLGLYGTWGAFRDPLVPRCYAIGMAVPSTMRRDYRPYAAIGTWPKRAARNQVHFRLSRKMAEAANITLRIGDLRIRLTGGGGDAWPASDTDNAAIIAAMRSATSMSVSSRDPSGRNFTNTWNLAGAASAMDAAALGCAQMR